ncbi:SLOG family protein [Streptomyces sp. NPDC004435]|uniref:SLOG family protein n=1 Tax=Streptomyces sp. NPDC004435 TaxID=3364701 RepID=UPI0036A542DD
MLILVTGSRGWTDARKVEREIFRALYEAKTPHREALLIHGACPTGADAQADRYAISTGMNVRRFHADWDRHGTRAGYLRNAAMVARVPDICLAFILDGSRGASMTATLAETAGIETRRFTACTE